MPLSDEELVDLLRRNTEVLNRGDFDAAIELADPDIVFVRAGGLPELRGTDAIRAWMEPDAFESQRYEILDYETEGNRVLTRTRTIARGAGSGIEMEIEALTVWTFNPDGKIARAEVFLVHDEDAAHQALRGG